MSLGIALLNHPVSPVVRLANARVKTLDRCAVNGGRQRGPVPCCVRHAPIDDACVIGVLAIVLPNGRRCRAPGPPRRWTACWNQFSPATADVRLRWQAQMHQPVRVAKIRHRRPCRWRRLMSGPAMLNVTGPVGAVDRAARIGRAGTARAEHRMVTDLMPIPARCRRQSGLE